MQGTYQAQLCQTHNSLSSWGWAIAFLRAPRPAVPHPPRSEPVTGVLARGAPQHRAAEAARGGLGRLITASNGGRARTSCCRGWPPTRPSCSRPTAVVTRAATAGQAITPAETWLLDNFYLIEQQIALARRHLPREYSRQLPRLREGSSAGYPRIYDLALDLISHQDGRIDRDNVGAFVAAYQTGDPLTLGELWAFPTMLRLGLLENISRVGARIARRREERDDRHRLGRPRARGGRRRAQAAYPRAGRVGRGPGAAHGHVRGGLLRPAPGPGAGHRVRPGLAGAPALAGGRQHGAAPRGGQPGRRLRPDLHRQQHRQPALHLGPRLGQVRRRV